MKRLLPINKHPRNNLPVHSSKKRTESNFVLAFGRAYYQDFLKDSENYSLEIAREFQINGFGIADLVSVLITPKKLALHAFEMKMGDWRGLLLKRTDISTSQILHLWFFRLMKP